MSNKRRNRTETVKQRRQLLEFSQWVEREANEKLMSSPTIPHDPPNAEENRRPSGLKIDNYGSSK